MKGKFKNRLSAFSYQLSATRFKLLVISCSLLVISCSLFTAFAADTTKVKSFSLKEAQDYAYKNNYMVQNAATDIEKANKLVWQMAAIGLPQVNASGSYQNFIDIPTQLIPGEFFGEAAGTFIPVKFGTKQNMSGSVSASQLIFDGSYFVGLQAAKTYHDLNTKTLTKTQAEVRESVAQAYYLVLIALENKKILDSTMIVTNKALEQTKQFQQAGFLEETDVEQLQLLASNLENKLNMVTRQVDIAYNLLKFQMGMDINQSIVLSDKLNDIVSSALVQNLSQQSFDYNNHINYKLLVALEKLDILQMRRDKVGYMPSMNAYISTSRSAYRNDFNFLYNRDPWYRTTVFGVSLSLPIWDSGVKHFKIQQDVLELKKHRVEMTQAQQGLLLDVQNNKSQVKTYTDQYFTEIKNMELAKKIYDKTLYKYKEGVSGSLDLTQVQNQYLTTQGNYFNTILQLLNANSNLNKALGN